MAGLGVAPSRAGSTTSFATRQEPSRRTVPESAHKVKLRVPLSPFLQRPSRDRPLCMHNGAERRPWEPDLAHAEWVVDVRETLGLSQAAFAEMVGTGRDTEAKWEGKAPDGPGFGFTRRIAAVAPPAQLVKFLGPQATAALCLALQENPALATEPVPEWRRQASVLIARMATLDEGARWKALARFEDAIEKQPPHAPQVGDAPTRKQAHGNETIEKIALREAKSRARKQTKSRLKQDAEPVSANAKRRSRSRHM